MGTLTTNFAFAATNFVVAFAVGVWLLVAVRRTGRTAAVAGVRKNGYFEGWGKYLRTYLLRGVCGY